jgi:hypothetical protein
MNYSNMTTAALQPSTASISLPPISSIDFHTQLAHRSSPEVVQPLPPPPPAPRVLPPLPYPYARHAAPPPPPPPPSIPHDYMSSRPIYPGLSSSYQPMPVRMPLPSTSDPNLIVAPPRHKAKEVKRRTKTGCLTCRKRRIKVSVFFPPSSALLDHQTKPGRIGEQDRWSLYSVPRHGHGPALRSPCFPKHGPGSLWQRAQDKKSTWGSKRDMGAVDRQV